MLFAPLLQKLHKQLLLQSQQLSTDLGSGALTFSDGRQIANHVHPAQLTLQDR